MVKEVIQNTLVQYAMPRHNPESVDVQFSIPDQLFFDVLKMETRGKTIQHCRRKKCQRTEVEKSIERGIEVLKTQVEKLDSLEKRVTLKKKQE